MRRLPDWNVRLNTALAELRRQPFAWDDSGLDCCRFAARIVEAMTGEDVMAGFSYATEDDAWLQLGAFGGLRSFLRHSFGPFRRPAFAHRGDVMLARGGKAVGICLGGRVAEMTEDGFRMAARANYVAAFPIGWPEASDG